MSSLCPFDISVGVGAFVIGLGQISFLSWCCWVELVFNVTINDISVIYVTAHRCAGGLKKLDQRSGSQRHRHFVGFFNVSVQAPTHDQPFYTVISTHCPNESPFTTHWGYGGYIVDSTPLALTRVVHDVRLGYCFTPYQRLWLYNDAPLVTFYDTLGIRRTYSRLKPPAFPRGCHDVT